MDIRPGVMIAYRLPQAQTVRVGRVAKVNRREKSVLVEKSPYYLEVPLSAVLMVLIEPESG